MSCPFVWHGSYLDAHKNVPLEPHKNGSFDMSMTCMPFCRSSGFPSALLPDKHKRLLIAATPVLTFLQIFVAREPLDDAVLHRDTPGSFRLMSTGLFVQNNSARGFQQSMHLSAVKIEAKSSSAEDKMSKS
jgi:hypothetical protein